MRFLLTSAGIKMLVHPWVCNAGIGCGATTLRWASVRE
jgi:hypothetical protein